MKRFTVFSAVVAITLAFSPGFSVQTAEACGVKIALKTPKKPSAKRIAKRKTTSFANKRLVATSKSDNDRKPTATGNRTPTQTSGTTTGRTRSGAGAGTGTTGTGTVARAPTTRTETPRTEPTRVAKAPAPKPATRAEAPVVKKDPPKVARIEQPKNDIKPPTRAPKPAPKARVSAKSMGSKIYFGTNSSNPRGNAKLRKLAAFLKANPGVSIDVVGFTDSTGPDEFNQSLSQQRAQAVVNALQGMGVDGSQLSAVGRGEESPRASNGTAKGRAANRRVEFRKR